MIGHWLASCVYLDAHHDPIAVCKRFVFRVYQVICFKKLDSITELTRGVGNLANQNLAVTRQRFDEHFLAVNHRLLSVSRAITFL